MPVEPVNGINKDVRGAKLQPTTVSAYPVDCDCLCHLPGMGEVHVKVLK